MQQQIELNVERKLKRNTIIPLIVLLLLQWQLPHGSSAAPDLIYALYKYNFSIRCAKEEAEN